MAANLHGMVNSDLNGFIIAMQTFACALHLIAPGAIAGEIPRMKPIGLGIIISLALASSLVIVGFGPTYAKQIVERIKPFVQFFDRNIIGMRGPSNGYRPGSAFAAPYAGSRAQPP